MAITYKDSTGNAMLGPYATLFPAGSILEIRTGAAPGPNAAATGTLLASITLPATPWAAAAGKSISKQGVWSVAAVGAGTAGHFRLKNAGDTEREEGSIPADMTLDNTNIAVGQTVTVSTFTRTS